MLLIATIETNHLRLLPYRPTYNRDAKLVTKKLTNKAIGALCACWCMCAGTALALDVVVSDAWTRATAPGQKVAGVYFDIESGSEARLVGVETGIADVAELHYMKMQDGVMRMRAMPTVDLPARETVKFAPGGLHVMLFELKRPLQAGEEFDLTLLVEDASGRQSRVNVSAEVRNFDGSKAHHHH